MSFSDLGAGIPTRRQGSSSGAHNIPIPIDIVDGASSIGDGEFLRLSEKIKGAIFAVSANVASIQRMVNQLGTQKDTHDLRDKLQNLMHATQELIKQTTNDLKAIGTHASRLDDDTSRMQRLAQQKLSKDFGGVIARFQQIQRTSAEKSREYVAKARAQTATLESDDGDGPLLQQEYQRQQALVKLDHEIEYNESIIAEREESIAQIEHAIVEVNEIFRDLGSLVNDQQGMVDNIEANIESAATRTGDAHVELQTADRYQKKARKRLCFILIILAIVLGVVLFAVLATKK